MKSMEWVIQDSPNKGNNFAVIEKTTVHKRWDDSSSNLETILANNPVTDLKYNYFEVSFRERTKHSNEIAIGLASKKIKVDGWPGDDDDEPAVAYHCTDGRIYLGGWRISWYDFEDGTKKDDPFLVTDVIGCGIGHDGRHFFTRNGRLMNFNYEVKHPRCVYPLITLGDTDTEVIANFGQEEFLYQHPKTFLDDWLNQLKGPKQSGELLFLPSYNDFTIISKDEEQIGCHRLVLSIRSKVLLEKIESSNEKEMKLDYDAKVIKLILNFMYTDKIHCIEDFDKSVILDLLQIANELKVLSNVFFEQFKEKINPEIAVDLWNLAYKLKQDECIKICGEFIFNHWEECSIFMEVGIPLSEKAKETAGQLFVFFSTLDAKERNIRKQLLHMMNN